MSGKRDKETLRRYLEQLYGEGKLSVADELYAENVRMHDPVDPSSGGPESVKEGVRMIRAAFTVSDFCIEEIIGEGDTYAYRWSSRSTHTGPFMNVPPTGRKVTVSGINIFRLSGDKIVEEWSNWDGLGMLQQLGVVPGLEQPAEKAA